MIKLGLAIMAILIIGVSTNTVFGQSTNEDLESRIIELENTILDVVLDGQSTNEELESRIMQVEHRIENPVIVGYSTEDLVSMIKALDEKVELLESQIVTLAKSESLLVELLIDRENLRYESNTALGELDDLFVANDKEYGDLWDKWNECETESQCSVLDSALTHNDNEWYGLLDVRDGIHNEITTASSVYFTALDNFWNQSGMKEDIQNIFNGS